MCPLQITVGNYRKEHISFTIAWAACNDVTIFRRSAPHCPQFWLSSHLARSSHSGGSVVPGFSPPSCLGFRHAPGLSSRRNNSSPIDREKRRWWRGRLGPPLLGQDRAVGHQRTAVRRAATVRQLRTVTAIITGPTLHRPQTTATAADGRGFRGSRSVVGGQWSVVGGRWSVVGGRRSVVGG